MNTVCNTKFLKVNCRLLVFSKNRKQKCGHKGCSSFYFGIRYDTSLLLFFPLIVFPFKFTSCYPIQKQQLDPLLYIINNGFIFQQ